MRMAMICTLALPAQCMPGQAGSALQPSLKQSKATRGSTSPQALIIWKMTHSAALRVVCKSMRWGRKLCGLNIQLQHATPAGLWRPSSGGSSFAQSGGMAFETSLSAVAAMSVVNSKAAMEASAAGNGSIENQQHTADASHSSSR